MIIYIVLLVLIFLSYAITKNLKYTDKNKKKIFLAFVGILLVLLAALRHKSVGTDSSAYWNDYIAGRRVTFVEAFTEWGENNAYYWVSGIFSGLGIPIQLWLGFLGAVSVGSVFYFIYKYSDNALFSVILYLSVGGYSFSLAGLKQVIAMALILFAFEQVLKRKPLRFLVLVLIATFFHQTAIVFLPIYWLSKVNSLKIQMVLYFLLTLFAFSSANSIIEFALGFLDNEHYLGYLEGDAQYSLVSFIIQLMMLLVCLFYNRGVKWQPHIKFAFFTMSFLGVMMQAYASTVASMFRLSVYFSSGLVVLMPSCLRSERNLNYRQALEFLAIFTFVAYYVYTLIQGSGVSNYKFYWQRTYL